MGIFELVYGSSGEGAVILGAWYVVGFFILGFFLLMLISQGTSSENIIWFVLAFFLIILNFGLFAMATEYIIVPIIIIILYISFIAYNIVNK